MDTNCEGCIFCETQLNVSDCKLDNINKFIKQGATVQQNLHCFPIIKNRSCAWKRDLGWEISNFSNDVKGNADWLKMFTKKIRTEIQPKYTVIIYDAESITNFEATLDSLKEQSLDLIDKVIVITNQSQGLYVELLNQYGKPFSIKRDEDNRNLESILNECVALNCKDSEYIVTIASGFQLDHNFIENVVSSMLDRLQINSIVLADKMLSHYPWNGMVIRKDAWQLSQHNNQDAGNVAQKTISLCKRYDCYHTVRSHKELGIEIH